MNNYGIILASGTGNRFGSDLPKQFSKIGSKTILEYTIEAFEKEREISNIIVVVHPDYIDFAKTIISQKLYKKIYKIVCGGETRKDSSYNGISVISDKDANVLIHDCARPFVSANIIEKCITALEKYPAVGVGVYSSDTIWEIRDNVIKSIPDRQFLMRAQTPQCFRLSLIKKAHELAKNDKNFTDDCGLVIKYGLSDIFVVEGDNKNIKITFPEDSIYAESIIKNNNNQ